MMPIVIRILLQGDSGMPEWQINLTSDGRSKDFGVDLNTQKMKKYVLLGIIQVAHVQKSRSSVFIPLVGACVTEGRPRRKEGK
jgi:hypothetical protein